MYPGCENLNTCKWLEQVLKKPGYCQKFLRALRLSFMDHLQKDSEDESASAMEESLNTQSGDPGYAMLIDNEFAESVKPNSLVKVMIMMMTMTRKRTLSLFSTCDALGILPSAITYFVMR